MTERLSWQKPTATNSSVLQRVKKLFKPTVATDIQTRRRLELLLPLLAGLIPLVFVGASLTEEPFLSGFLWFLTFLLALAFGLAHTAHHQYSFFIVIFGLSLAPFAGVTLQEQFTRDEVASIFVFLMPSLILAQIFFTAKEFVVMSIAIILGIVIMVLAIPGLAFTDTVGALGLILPTVTLLLIAQWYRDNLEKERLSQLEQLVESSEQMANRAIEANRLKSELLAKVSHELRTPVGAILGTTQLLQSQTYGELNEKQLATLGRVVKRTRDLGGLVNDILDEAQLEQGTLQIQPLRFPTQELIAQCLDTMQTLADAKSLRLVTELDPAMPEYLNHDAGRLNQIVNNLVGNGIKYTAAGEVKLRITPARTEDSWMIEVSDTGSGIDAEKRDLIFQPFRQGNFSIRRDESGVGLGLAIVHQLTDIMGGHIELQSELNRGSTFRVVLPFELAEDRQEQI